MQLDPEVLRQYYDRLSDDGLLEVAREDLVDVALEIYDAELARRGLQPIAVTPREEPAPPSPSSQGGEADGLVVVAEFDNSNEASLAQAALVAAGIPASIRILVPRESLDAALEVLAPPISDEELAALAEAAGRPPKE